MDIYAYYKWGNKITEIQIASGNLLLLSLVDNGQKASRTTVIFGNYHYSRRCLAAVE